ncbi:hypothetical protein [Pyrobaculum neutrophilum]|uniref:C2H2-type domain-containing protein n=1 Tax=Pyrobaculum neutrophilum (strain DSM 2338 / JCM 9278 / NBRC 100436 / V24Sta) TaxID=444157 RepID=B1YB68_PYRNV|nr:hypothetical protein [Pyrobaculum neutrophilum]ACB39199.1 hypothetical protein Tneu_0246 [Pyrobaculum neutrophilum V24Sta]
MEIPQELKSYLAVEADQWDVKHIVCLKCRKKFFTVRDAALHLHAVHGLKAAQKYISASHGQA